MILESLRPHPLSPHPLQQAENRGVAKLAIQLEQVTDLRLAVMPTPLSGKPEPELRERQIIPLALW